MQLLEEIYLQKVYPNAELLMESKFDKYMKMFEKYPLLHSNDEINRRVKFIIDILKKDDRITYTVNWYRLYRLNRFLEQHGIYNIETLPPDEVHDDSILPYVKGFVKELQTMSKRAGISVKQVENILNTSFYILSFLSNMQEYLSAPIPEIQNMVWDLSKTPNQLVNILRDRYEEYKKEFKDVINPSPNDTIVMDFGDGYAWWDLHAIYMPKTISGDRGPESKIMQHCGNDYDRNSTTYPHKNDRVYSLRKGKNIGKEKKYSPHVTAVINGDTLIEMKGKQNYKPDSTYHKYIIPFIKSDLIKKMDSTESHQPKVSFSLNDLDEATRKEILQLKGEDFEMTEELKNKQKLARFIIELPLKLRELNDQLKFTKVYVTSTEEMSDINTSNNYIVHADIKYGPFKFNIPEEQIFTLYAEKILDIISNIIGIQQLSLKLDIENDNVILRIYNNSSVHFTDVLSRASSWSDWFLRYERENIDDHRNAIFVALKKMGILDNPTE